jgi:CMP-N-acetylneuraminic acid synthetase
MKIYVIIPARIGSQRLKKKNLRNFDGEPLIYFNLRKILTYYQKNNIYINSDSLEFKKVAEDLNVNFYLRPSYLGSNSATSEDFITDFLEKHDCDFVIQLHSITPLIGIDEIMGFTELVKTNQYDTILSYTEIQLECVLGEEPINFSLERKTNSQELEPVKRISWAISAWRKNSFLNAKQNKRCGTYNGKVGYYKIREKSGIAIKNIEDFELARFIKDYEFKNTL